MEGQSEKGSGWLTGLGMALSGVIGGVVGYFVGKKSTDTKGECACKLTDGKGGNGNGSGESNKKA